MTAAIGGRATARVRTLGAGSVGLVALAEAVAVAFGPGGGWFLVTGIVGALAIGVALNAVVKERVGIVTALLVAVLPVLGLLADGSPAWLIGPAGVALFLAAELHALSWELRGGGAVDGLAERRLGDVARVAAAGLVASLLVWLADLAPSPSGTAATVLAVAALAGLACTTFARGPSGPS